MFWFISTTHKFILRNYTVKVKEFPEVHRRTENRYIAYRCYREGVNFNIQHILILWVFDEIIWQQFMTVECDSHIAICWRAA